MYFKIVRNGKTDSYPFEDYSRCISTDGEHWQPITIEHFDFPKDLVEKAFSYKLKKNERREFIKED